jgi:transcriptional regulator with XRE-family HTH domain
MSILKKKKAWQRLAKDKKYREEYAIAMLKRMMPYQIRAIRKKRGWSQGQLAEAANLTQGVISRAEDPSYGNLTLTTIGRIAAGYDLAAIIKLVPFSELIRYSENTTEREFAELRTFTEEESADAAPLEGAGLPSQGQICVVNLASASGAMPGQQPQVVKKEKATEKHAPKHSSVRIKSRRGSIRRVRSYNVGSQERETNRSYQHVGGSGAETLSAISTLLTGNGVENRIQA